MTVHGRTTIRRGMKIISSVIQTVVLWRKKTPMLANSRIRTMGVTGLKMGDGRRETGGGLTGGLANLTAWKHGESLRAGGQAGRRTNGQTGSLNHQVTGHDYAHQNRTNRGGTFRHRNRPAFR